MKHNQIIQYQLYEPLSEDKRILKEWIFASDAEYVYAERKIKSESVMDFFLCKKELVKEALKSGERWTACKKEDFPKAVQRMFEVALIEEQEKMNAV